MTWGCRRATAALVFLLAANAAFGDDFVTYWRPPKGMNDYDLRIASSECQKRVRQTKGNSIARQAVFEACMRGLGATLVDRSRNGLPANGPIRR